MGFYDHTDFPDPNFFASYGTSDLYMSPDLTHAVSSEMAAMNANIDRLEGLADGLEANKASTNHTHTAASIGAAAATHGHAQSEVTGLATALAGKAPTDHDHAQADITGLTSALAGKAAADHDHTPSEVGAAAATHGHAQGDITGLNAALAGKAAEDHGHTQSEITGLTTALAGKAAADHDHAQGDITGLATALAGKAAADHTHAPSEAGAAAAVHGHGQGDITGLAAALAGKAAATHGHTPDAIGAAAEEHTHAQGDITGLTSALQNKAAADHEHTAAEVGAAASSHTHTAASIGAAAATHSHGLSGITGLLDMLLTAENGDVKQSLTGKDMLATFKAAPIGVMTYYAPANTTNSPKAGESWRFISHKTGLGYGWFLGFSNMGSVYSNYLDNGNWRGWKAIYDNSGAPLWSGNAYLNSPNSTPQTVTPSKKLSQCRTGWLLLWSDYDPGVGSNDSDFVTTIIPKKKPNGSNWSGQSFYCDIPRYIGSNVNDVDTERRIIKSIYIHDDCIKGSFNNDKDERNDVVLRAVYEI